MKLHTIFGEAVNRVLIIIQKQLYHAFQWSTLLLSNTDAPP